jgi:hypothetical protein
VEVRRGGGEGGETNKGVCTDVVGVESGMIGDMSSRDVGSGVVELVVVGRVGK